MMNNADSSLDALETVFFFLSQFIKYSGGDGSD